MTFVMDGKTFADEFDYAYEEISKANPKFRLMNPSPNVDDRREEKEPAPEVPLTQDVLDQYEGKFINPALEVDDPLAKALGANTLNALIIQAEKNPDAITQLLKKLERLKIPEKALPKK